MAGPASIQASSAAYATIPNQYGTALGSGWILDQRLDLGSTGGFLTNASPTSSGKTFQSTGDGTAFYLKGRALQVIQAGTAICTVGQSSFSGGITNVFLNSFSTAAGLSTALSTGAITSVAASPLVAGATGNAYGGAVPQNTTGGGSYINPLTVGASAASSGFVRVPNSAIAIVGKTSTGGDDIIWPQTFLSTTLAADVQSSGTAYTSLISKSLAVGTWHIVAGVTFMSTIGASHANARIDDGTNVYAAASVLLNAGSTIEGYSVSVSAIVSHTTALTYNLAINANTTSAAKALAITPTSTASPSTGATFFTAVKIG